MFVATKMGFVVIFATAVEATPEAAELALAVTPIVEAVAKVVESHIISKGNPPATLALAALRNRWA